MQDWGVELDQIKEAFRGREDLRAKTNPRGEVFCSDKVGKGKGTGSKSRWF